MSTGRMDMIRFVLFLSVMAFSVSKAVFTLAMTKLTRFAVFWPSKRPLKPYLGFERLSQTYACCG